MGSFKMGSIAISMVAMGIVLTASAVADTADSLETRVTELEARLDLIDQKFKLLGADSMANLGASEEMAVTAAKLYAQAERSKETQQYELSYRQYALIRALYPDSEEAKKAYPNAAGLFKRFYSRNRHKKPRTTWTTSEPIFMYDWVTIFFGETFPQDEMLRLFKGMPSTFFEKFEQFGAKHPEISKWKIGITKDNGIVEEIDAERLAN